MKTLILTAVLSLALAQSALAGQENEGLPADQTLCGQLTGLCMNGADTCRKWITPTYCTNGGPCAHGQSVQVAGANDEASQALQSLLGKGEGTYVCAEGHIDNGVFVVQSAKAE